MPPIAIKQIVISHLNSLNIKKRPRHVCGAVHIQH